MKDIDLSSMISLAKEVFGILEREYKVFLSKEKINLIENLDYENLFKLTNRLDLPPIFLNDETYYLRKSFDNINSNSVYGNYLKNTDINEVYNKMIIFMCLSFFCGDINPLKLGLMEFEIRKLSKKYGINVSDINNYKELEISNIVKEKILNDVPFNIIFLDSDIEIFNYLTEEKGIQIAKIYYQISNMMKESYKDFNKSFDLDYFCDYYDNIDYTMVSKKLEEIIGISRDFIEKNCGEVND